MKIICVYLCHQRQSALKNGGRRTSDAGAILLQKVDQKLQLSERINQIIHDPRDPNLTTHQQRDLLAQRIFSIALG